MIPRQGQPRRARGNAARPAAAARVPFEGSSEDPDEIYDSYCIVNGERQPLYDGPYIPLLPRLRELRERIEARFAAAAAAAAVPVSPASPAGDGNLDSAATNPAPQSPQQPISEAVGGDISGDEVADDLGGGSAIGSARGLGKVRGDIAGSFFADFLSNQQRRMDLVVAEKVALEAQLIDPKSRCPKCSATGGHSETGSQAGVVLVATLAALHEIELRCLRCSNVECRFLFVVKPTQLACMPGSQNAWTLSRTSDIKPLWFHMDLLSFLDSHHYHAKSSSLYSFVQVMEEQWLRAREMAHSLSSEDGQEGWQPQCLPVSMDTVRRQMGDALREYQHLLTMCDNSVETLGLDNWPNNRHNPCSACDPKAMHVHFDLCFGLPMLRRAYTLKYDQPPNTRLIVPNSKVQQVVQDQPLGDGQQHQELEQQQLLGEQGQSREAQQWESQQQ